MILATIALLLAPEVPSIVQRKAVPYAAIRSTETMETMASLFPRNMPKLHQWLGEHHLEPIGPEFLRFINVDMQKGLVVELGQPLAKRVPGDKLVVTGVIPAGRYVSLIHHGDYAGLVAPNGALQDWAKKRGLKFKMRKSAKGSEFVSRLEIYNTNPDTEPDKSKWETEILYMIEG